LIGGGSELHRVKYNQKAIEVSLRAYAGNTPTIPWPPRGALVLGIFIELTSAGLLFITDEGKHLSNGLDI